MGPEAGRQGVTAEGLQVNIDPVGQFRERSSTLSGYQSQFAARSTSRRHRRRSVIGVTAETRLHSKTRHEYIKSNAYGGLEFDSRCYTVTWKVPRRL